MMKFLRPLRKFKLPQELLITVHTVIVQSVLSTSITVWFGANKRNNSRQQTLKSAETNRLYSGVIVVQKSAGFISADPSYPRHKLLELLPSGYFVF